MCTSRVKCIKTVTARGESLDEHQKAIAPSSVVTIWAYEGWESVQDEKKGILGIISL